METTLRAGASRRSLLRSIPAIAASISVFAPAIARAAAEPTTAPSDATESFPAHSPAVAREIVGAAHRDLVRVKQLLSDAPQLANAAIDWGFGDWETPLGAAAHTGGREMAALLLANGARPDLFAFTMLGDLDVVKAMTAGHPGIQKLRGPHGLSLLHHARMGGERSKAVLEYLTQLGDADPKYIDLPLNDEQRKAYIGDYAFGPAEVDRFRVFVPKQQAQLAIQRGKQPPRNLFNQGDHTFIPAGGNDVRIVFNVIDGRAETVVTSSPAPVLTATRV